MERFNFNAGGAFVSNAVLVAWPETWQAAPHFRWHKADADAPAVLQQAWASSGGKVEWREVPVVVGDES